MQEDLVRLVLAALTHGLPDDLGLPAGDAALRAAFHATTVPAGCPAALGRVARASHSLVAGPSGSAGHLAGPLQTLWPRIELLAPITLPTQVLAPGPAPAITGPDDAGSRAVLFPSAHAAPMAPQQWQVFDRDLALALGPHPADDGTVARVLGALRRFAGNLPAHLVDEPLLEHLTLVAATAAALWHVEGMADHTPDEPLALVLIDLSGIQRYLFATANPTVGGIARRLRGRSLTLSLVAEALAHALLQALDLPMTNLLATSGGHCYLLVPHTPAVLAGLVRAWHDLEQDLWRHYGGALAATLAWRPLAPGDLLHAGAALHDLAARRATVKMQPLADLLRDATGWRADTWVSPEGFSGRTVCSACGIRPATTTVRDGDVCVACAGDYHLGAGLPRARYLVWYRPRSTEAPADTVEVLPGFYVQTARAIGEIAGTPFLVQALNNFEVPREPLPLLGRYLATHVPTDADGAPLDFARIARDAAGAPLLAVVKADVDRLGALFAWGLRRDDDSGADSLARVLALSRLVDTFFSGWVQGLLAGRFSRCYTIYSGGDDLLLVGPWNEAIALLDRLHADFAAYTGHPHITLSAGTVIIRPSTPIADAVHAADKQEALAKEAGPTGGRNQLALFDLALSWHQAAALLGRWQALIATDTRLPGSALHRWLGYVSAFQRTRESGDAPATHEGDLRAVTHFTYDYARNRAELSQPFREEWQRILSALFEGRVAETMAEAGVLARLLLLSQRRRD
jgi:CRISPR-associated protein Csm1